MDYLTLKNWAFPPIEHSYRADDSMLYALSVGLGADHSIRTRSRSRIGHRYAAVSITAASLKTAVA